MALGGLRSWWDRTIAALVRKRIGAVVLALLSLAVFAVACWAYAFWTTDADRIVEVELSGTLQGAQGIPALVAGHENDYLHALHVDFGFIAGYVLAIVLATALGRSLAFTKTARRISSVAMLAAVAAGLADVGENAMLMQVVPAHGSRTEDFAVAAQAFAFTKFVLIL